MIKTEIHAPIETVFDLARSVDVHTQTTSRTGEHVIDGRLSGLLEVGDTVTFRAKHFGVWQNLKVRISEMDMPHLFTDEMIEGAFRSLRHVHRFELEAGITVMTDEFNYTSPLGLLGSLADRLFLIAYMTKFLQLRAKALKDLAEAPSIQLS